ncbi:MAG TPA: glycosyltransferase family 39 protein [Gemmatimonadaceae bacterium]|nr:glycosyltransferase family 39 protein [Gemmatimonadaceae bacterium]
MLILLVPLVLIVAVLALGIHLPNKRFARLLTLPTHRYAPLVAGLVTGAAVWYVWGSLRAVAPVHDEASYLLQARTFASFHWAMPAPPLPEFFEQYHALVTPVYASKYPPGHGLLLVPGIWLSLPGLTPVLLSVLAGALLFMLVRRVANGWVAVLTFVLWLSTIGNLRWRGSYLSETTTSALWLLGWWALLEWRERRANRWLVVLAGCVAWMAITRPFTAVAYAIPVGIVVIADVVKRRSWRELVRPILVALAIVAILPLANKETLGNWRTAPYETYTATYLPWDHLGFGVTDTPAQRPLPPDMQQFSAQFISVHAGHTLNRLPSIYLIRWRAILADAFHGWRIPLALFALIGFSVLGIEGWLAVASALLLTGVYLLYASIPNWTVYYLEIFPVIPFLVALGIWTVAAALVTPRLHVGPRLVREEGPRQAFAIALVVLMVLWPGGYEVHFGRRVEAAVQAYHGSFRQRLAALPDRREIIFVRYAPWHSVHQSLIANEPNLATAKRWFVYDRGEDNQRLAALAPDREPFLFDENSGTFVQLKRTLARR